MADTAIQRHLPRRRNGQTISVTIGGERFSLTANGREDDTLGEVLIQWGKQGTTGSGLMDVYAAALSLGLRHGVPLADLVAHGIDLRFGPYGHTDDPEIPRVRSVADWVARRLAIDWLPYEERARLGIHTVEERVEKAADWLTIEDADLPTGRVDRRESAGEPEGASPGGDPEASRAELVSGIGAPTGPRA
jgi:ribonucleoside-diphosphate reductase alpha chain